jgi:hypothetical protein
MGAAGKGYCGGNGRLMVMVAMLLVAMFLTVLSLFRRVVHFWGFAVSAASECYNQVSQAAAGQDYMTLTPSCDHSQTIL